MIALDTNVMIRLFTRDDEAKAERCFQLLQCARRGEVELLLCEAVLAEAVYVLSSSRLYGLSRMQVRDRLLPILELRGVHLQPKCLYRRALELYAATNIKFEDALLVAHMEENGIAQVYSYDQHFDIPDLGVERLEP